MTSPALSPGTRIAWRDCVARNRIVLMHPHESVVPWLNTALVVEDSAVLAAALVRQLEALGATMVLSAPSVERALPLVDASLDLILSDVCLPDGNCLPVLEALRDRAHTTRFVIMTGEAGPRVCTELAFRGAHAFLEKPFGLGELKDALRSMNIEALAGPRVDDLVLLGGLKATERYVRRRACDEAMRRTHGNVTVAARDIGVTRGAFYALLEDRSIADLDDELKD